MVHDWTPPIHVWGPPILNFNSKRSECECSLWGRKHYGSGEGEAMEVTTFSAFISSLSWGNDSEHFDVKRRRSLLHPFAGSLLARSFSDVWGMGFIDRIPRRCWLSRPRPLPTRYVFTQERFCVKTKVVVFLRSTVYPLMPLTQKWILVWSPNNYKQQFLMRHCADDEGMVQIQFSKYRNLQELS